MMQALLQKAVKNNIMILNQVEVTSFQEQNDCVEIAVADFSFKTKKILFATNGFAGKLTDNQVKPARAQVLITEPIPNLDIKGTFHLDKGYYYFRNIDDRILFGGGRNLDFEAETTTEFELNHFIQDTLLEKLQNEIIPGQKVEIEAQWSGIMCVGDQKKPLIRSLNKNVHAGVRMGGMGIAIGSAVGEALSKMV
jgi:glycine/D-amino acid oxidase-like deaminating enzyme